MIKGILFFFAIMVVILLIVGGQTNEIIVIPTQENLINGDLNVQGTAYIDENIILYSPDGNTWTCNVNNTGTFSCN